VAPSAADPVTFPGKVFERGKCFTPEADAYIVLLVVGLKRPRNNN